MKNSLFIAAFLLLIFNSCKKDLAHTAFPPPVWQEDQTGKYPVSMTAVLSTFYPLNADFLPDDKFAAFVGNECRGVGTLVKVSATSSVFFVMIHGTAAEQSNITFKYYSSKTSFMYTTGEVLPFKIDSNFGTADKPEIVKLNQTE